VSTCGHCARSRISIYK